MARLRRDLRFGPRRSANCCEHSAVVYRPRRAAHNRLRCPHAGFSSSVAAFTRMAERQFHVLRPLGSACDSNHWRAHAGAEHVAHLPARVALTTTIGHRTVVYSQRMSIRRSRPAFITLLVTLLLAPLAGPQALQEKEAFDPALRAGPLPHGVEYFLPNDGPPAEPALTPRLP